MDRILQELQMHTRLSAGVSKGSLVLDYGQMLRDHIVTPLVNGGAEGVDRDIKIFIDYSLLKKDLDGLLEVTQWPERPFPFRNVDRKTKANLTRRFNKMGMFLPYSITMTDSMKKGEVCEGMNIVLGDCENMEEDEVAV